MAIPDLDGASATVETSAPAGTSNVTVVIPASATKGVRLWHPRGNGGQFRYNVTATWKPAAPVDSEARGSHAVPAAVSSAPSTWRLLGFRHVALVTINDTDAAAVAAAKDQDGTGAWQQSSCDLPLLLKESFQRTTLRAVRVRDRAVWNVFPRQRGSCVRARGEQGEVIHTYTRACCHSC